MAKTRNQHEKDILKVIQEKKIFRISHIFSHYPDITRATFYNWNFDKLDSISNALLQNREKAKEYMLQKWVAGSNPTLQIAAFRLLADKEEHMLLNQQYIDHTTKGEKIQSIDLTNYTEDELRTIAELQRKGGIG